MSNLEGPVALTPPSGGLSHLSARADRPARATLAAMVKRILLASPRGYCAGVERAVETVEQALELYGAPVYVRKQIVHNIHVVRDLEARGRDLRRGRERGARGRDRRLLGPRRRAGGARERRGAAAGHDRRDLPARDEGARAGAALRGRGLHRRPDRPRRPRGGRRARWARRPTRSCSSSRTTTPSALELRRADAKLAYITQTTLSVDETQRDHRRAAPALPADPRAEEGRHLLRDLEPPVGGQGDAARGRLADRDRLAELVELEAARRRRARGRRAGAS